MNLLSDLKQQRDQVSHLENVMHDRLLAGVAKARASGFASSLKLMAFDLANLRARTPQDICCKCLVHAEAAKHLPDAFEIGRVITASISRDINALGAGTHVCAERVEACPSKV